MTTPAVTLHVLGPVTATVAGEPVDLGGPRPRAVLARLAMAGGQVVSTDRILDDLWNAEGPAKALAALQVHVSGLRRTLEPGRARRAPASVLISAAPGYALRLGADVVDAWRFEALVRRSAETATAQEQHGLLGQALACWSGPAYAEVADHEWAIPEVTRLTELRLSAVEGLAEADLALGRPAAVIPDLERHLHDHPGREDAVRLLALALYRTGRQGDALAVLRRAREHLADELGVDPGPALRSLEASILAQAPDLDRLALPVSLLRRSPGEPPTERAEGAGNRVPPTPVATAVGRVAELAAVAAAAGAAASGARVVWVSADAGAGKTTFVEAATADLRAAGWQVAWGRCPEVDGAPPGWAWSEVVRGLVTSAPDAADDALAPLLHDGAPVADPNPFWLARAVTGLFAAVEATSGAPLAVVLDDVHRADGLTLQILRQVIGSMTTSPLLVIATYRPAEAGDELATTRAALVPVTSADLPLAGLAEDAVAVLAADYGLPDAPPDVVRLLTERTGGNPLFVRELVRLVAAEGVRAARTAVPDGVREVLRRRTARLPDPVKTALRQAAVLGRTVDVDVLAIVAGRDPDDLADTLETAVVAGLLDEPDPGMVRFTHALIRDTLYEDTPLLRRTRLHAAALDVLREHGDAATLAHHAAASASPATAASCIPYVTAAAREAEGVGAWGAAARQWRSALALHELGQRRTGAPADRDADVLDLLVPAITATARSGDTIEARRLFVRAISVAAPLGRHDLTTTVLTAWDAPMIWSTRGGAPDPAVLAAIDSALAGALTPAERVWVLIAQMRESEGVDLGTAWRCTAEAVEIARTLQHEPDGARLLAAALNVYIHGRLGPDRAVERHAAGQELLDHATATKLVDYEAVAHWLLFLDDAAVTDLQGAFAHVGAAVTLCGTGELGSLISILEIFAAFIDVLAGRLDQGIARYERVAAALIEQGAQNGFLIRLVGRTSAGLLRGDLSGLVDDLVPIDVALPGLVTAALVLALLDDGQHDHAATVWATRLPVQRDYHWLANTALHSLAAVRLNDRDSAPGYFDDLLPYTGRVAGLDGGTLCAGMVDDALAGLADVLDRPELAADHRARAAQTRKVVQRALESVGRD